MRNESVEKQCLHCGKIFKVIHSRKDSAKFCGRECSDKHPKPHNEVRCRECGSLFKLKKSQEERNKVWGSFCSNECIASYRSRVTIGSGNPNYKGRVFDYDGYRISTPQASLKLGLGSIKVHHAVSLKETGLNKIPKSMHVHHRDCDVLNNEPDNLVFMTMSDHKWIHKQYGSSVLKAMMSGKIEASTLASWSDDPLRAFPLLIASVKSQGVFLSHFTEKNVTVDIAQIAAAKAVIVDFEVVDEF